MLYLTFSAWSVFSHGCHIAEQMGLLHTDDPNYTHSPPLSESEKLTNRLIFWQLYQFDSSFSLQAGKTTGLKDGTWHVDLPIFTPWLQREAHINHQHQVIFIALTRLAQVQRKIPNLFAPAAENIVPAGTTLDTLVGKLVMLTGRGK